MIPTTIRLPEITINDLGSRETTRKNSVTAETIVKIPLDKILIREGFNVRNDYGDIEGLAQSILENGQAVPGRVDVLEDGTFLLTDGHRRYEAFCLLAEKNGSDLFFKAIVNTQKTTEEQRILQMFTTQDNKQLTPNEIAELINRLINLGHTQKNVAIKIGKTPSYISQMFSYYTENVEIKNHVANGDISVSTVLKLQKEIPIQSERVKAVNNAIKEKKEAKSVNVESITGKQNKKLDKLCESIIKNFDLNDEQFQELKDIIKKFIY